MVLQLCGAAWICERGRSGKSQGAEETDLSVIGSFVSRSQLVNVRFLSRSLAEGAPPAVGPLHVSQNKKNNHVRHVVLNCTHR